MQFVYLFQREWELVRYNRCLPHASANLKFEATLYFGDAFSVASRFFSERYVCSSLFTVNTRSDLRRCGSVSTPVEVDRRWA